MTILYPLYGNLYVNMTNPLSLCLYLLSPPEWGGAEWLRQFMAKAGAYGRRGESRV